MRSSIVLISAFATMALGQNSTGTTYTFPQGFNIGQVKPDELSELTQTLFPKRPSLTNVLSFQTRGVPASAMFAQKFAALARSKTPAILYVSRCLGSNLDLIRSDQIIESMTDLFAENPPIQLCLR